MKLESNAQRQTHTMILPMLVVRFWVMCYSSSIHGARINIQHLARLFSPNEMGLSKCSATALTCLFFSSGVLCIELIAVECITWFLLFPSLSKVLYECYLSLGKSYYDYYYDYSFDTSVGK
ncbi:hypothetical protein ILYODFUR_012985 [Ilyodon furcidens]|uniref:Uncharacterized protein n=1 Tax=Ilyodon furcidens TaxID=33524 RepID=A0ABV0SWJ5_9TELE